MATLHRPMARAPESTSAWVTMPTGLVKSTIQAPGAARRAASSAISRTTGTVRSALARPPGPVVSWPRMPKRCGGSVRGTEMYAPSLNPSIGVLLNVTPDHLDRHGTMPAYAPTTTSAPQQPIARPCPARPGPLRRLRGTPGT